jgi:glycosyltransferase involved in cell wall biosynthesis
LLLEAIRILVSERGCSVEGHFCGRFVPENDGNFAEETMRMKKEFQQLVDAGRLSNNVYYHGTVSGESKRTILTKSDLFVLPTRYPNEGQPIALIEAMAHGLVVLATPIASIPDLIDDRATGILIPPRPEAIADALEQLLKDPVAFQTISSGAIQRYHRYHTPEAHLNAIIPYLLGREDLPLRAHE